MKGQYSYIWSITNVHFEVVTSTHQDTQTAFGPSLLTEYYWLRDVVLLYESCGYGWRTYFMLYFVDWNTIRLWRLLFNESSIGNTDPLLLAIRITSYYNVMYTLYRSTHLNPPAFSQKRMQALSFVWDHGQSDPRMLAACTFLDRDLHTHSQERERKKDNTDNTIILLFPVFITLMQLSRFYE